MTGTNLQRKRSERGASLILLVSIIGLAFIVTVAAFLVAASNGQNTARLASAKVDIATREDALMRDVLQHTATGMLPGTNGVTGPILNWTAIMTNAAPGEALRNWRLLGDDFKMGDPRQSRAWTLLHLPAVTVPALIGPQGLPVGVQFLSPFGSDQALLGVARWAESVLKPSLLERLA